MASSTDISTSNYASIKYDVVRTNMTNIVKALKVIKGAATSLGMKFQEKRWHGITSNPSEEELVKQAVWRIEQQEEDFEEFISMLSSIDGMDITVEQLTSRVEELQKTNVKETSKPSDQGYADDSSESFDMPLDETDDNTLLKETGRDSDRDRMAIVNHTMAPVHQSRTETQKSTEMKDMEAQFKVYKKETKDEIMEEVVKIIGKLTVKMETMEQRIAGFGDEIKQLRKILTEHEKTIEEQKKTIDQKNKEIIHLRGSETEKIRDLRENIRKKDIENKEMQAQLMELEKESAESDPVRIAKLEQSLASERDRSEEQGSANEELQETIRALEKELAERDSKFKILKKKADDQTKELDLNRRTLWYTGAIV